MNAEKPLQQIKDILINSIKDFKNDIELMINKETLKNKLNDIFNDISHVKIMLFIYLIKKDNMIKQITEFMKLYEIDENEENINKLKKHYEYFLQIKEALL